MHAEVEPGHFKNVRPHVTRTVNWTPGGATFPLFARSIEHNETIKGIEQCGAHMRQERARRKKEVAPKFSVDEAKAFRVFASFKKLKSVAMEAGRELQPDEKAKMEMPQLFPIDPDNDTDVANAEIPFENWSDEDKLKAYVLPLIGRSAQIHSLKEGSQFNWMLVDIESYDDESQMFETRFKKSKAMFKIGI